MAQKPRSLQEPILAPLALALIGIISTASALGALALFGHFYYVYGNPVEGHSIVFASFAINSTIHIFGYRSLRRSQHCRNSRQNEAPDVRGWTRMGSARLTIGLGGRQDTDRVRSAGFRKKS